MGKYCYFLHSVPAFRMRAGARKSKVSKVSRKFLNLTLVTMQNYLIITTHFTTSSSEQEVKANSLYFLGEKTDASEYSSPVLFFFFLDHLILRERRNLSHLFTFPNVQNISLYHSIALQTDVARLPQAGQHSDVHQILVEYQSVGSKSHFPMT